MKTSKRSHCNSCLQETDHDILCHHDETMTIDGPDITFWDNYYILRCKGCKTTCFEKIQCDSDDLDYSIGPDGTYETIPAETVTKFPPIVKRQKPSWINDICDNRGYFHTDLQDLMDELYVALESDTRRLAAMGVRAIIEFVMIDKVGDQNSFEKNISRFESEGFISKINREFIEKTLEIGHASIHRNHKPTSDDLSTMVDIIENLIQQLYVHGKQVDKLQKVPPRGSSPKVK